MDPFDDRFGRDTFGLQALKDAISEPIEGVLKCKPKPTTMREIEAAGEDDGWPREKIKSKFRELAQRQLREMVGKDPVTSDRGAMSGAPAHSMEIDGETYHIEKEYEDGSKTIFMGVPADRVEVDGATCTVKRVYKNGDLVVDMPSPEEGLLVVDRVNLSDFKEMPPIKMEIDLAGPATKLLRVIKEWSDDYFQKFASIGGAAVTGDEIAIVFEDLSGRLQELCDSQIDDEDEDEEDDEEEDHFLDSAHYFDIGGAAKCQSKFDNTLEFKGEPSIPSPRIEGAWRMTDGLVERFINGEWQRIEEPQNDERRA